MERPGYVDGVLNYIAPMVEKPYVYTYDPPPDTLPRSGKPDRRTVQIHDARTIIGQLSLDSGGFAFQPHTSEVLNFYNDAEVRRVYYPEVERLVKEITGAVTVLVFDHNVRRGAQQGENGVRAPVKFVHNDYTVRSGPQRVRDLLPAAEAEIALKNRFVMINVWRPIKEPVQELPLAVCDARSMTLGDFVATDLRYRERTGEIYSVTFSSDHRWFYFPLMERGEVIFLKCFDSAQDGRARFTAHSAFEDPSSRRDAAPRESIEARTIAFFA